MQTHAFSLLSVLLLFLTCCSRTPQPSRGSVRAGGSFKLIYQSSPEMLDPQRLVFLSDWEAASLVYEGLVGYGDSPASIRPLLAESWSESDGGKRWVFKLRGNAWFHDDPCFPGGRGRKVTARDVLYTFERVARIKAQCPNWYLFSGKIAGIDDFSNGLIPTIKGIAILDDLRIEIRLTKPYATFLKILASTTACVVPSEAVEFYGANFGSHPVGTGPFRLVRWKPQEQMLFSRHDRYWRSDPQGLSLPYLDSIAINFRDDAAEPVLLAEFLKGETYLFAAQEKLYERIKGDVLSPGKYQVAGVLPTSSVRFLGFSLDKPGPLARYAELRRAVAMAFDRRQLAGQSPQVNVILANTLVPPLFLNRTFSWHPYDLDQSRKIFAAHLQELQEDPPILASNFQSGDVELLQRALARVSVRSTVQIRPAEYYQYLVKNRPSVFRVSYVPSFFDPEDYYCLFYSKSSPDVNLTGYRNAEFDRTLEAAMIQPDQQKRTELFHRLEDILHRDVPAIYLSHGTPMYLVASPFVRGIKIRFIQPDFTETWLENRDGARNRPEP